MTTLRIADFAERESHVTFPQWKCGQRLAEIALDDIHLLDVEPLAELTHQFDVYYPWYRIKAPRANIRVIVEIRQDSDEVVLIVVNPRGIVYADLIPLWKRYRAARKS